MKTLTLDRSATCLALKTSNFAAWPRACSFIALMSCGENFDDASAALTPRGNVSKDFRSFALVIALLIDVPSECFFGRPRSIIEVSDSVRR